jgi:hypothetical protein
MYSDVIFENYELFLKEHKDDISTPMGAIEMLSSDGAFRAYVAAITEGLTPTAKGVVSAVCEREREMLLEESANIGPSASAIGYAVTYFPILADIYSDPIISEIATIYPVNKSIITIPRIKIQGSVTNVDGTVSKFRMPRSNILERQKATILALLPNVSNNLFTLANVDNSETMRVNKRYLIITDIAIADNDTPANSHTVALSLRPDARGQITKDFTFTDANNTNAVVSGRIVGNVDFDRGIVQYGCTFSSASPATYSAVSVNCSTIFSAITSDVGRVKVKLEVDGWDASVDVRDDFELELTTETLQDYNDIWNLDLVRTLSEAIRLQMLLNKDYDLAYFLKSYEAEMAANGASLNLNLDTYKMDGNKYQPNNSLDVFKSIIPMISSIRRKVRQNYRADPQYILAGLKTASILESLQEYVVSFSETRRGEAGFSGDSNIGFSKMKILHSDVLDESKVYIVYKPTGDDLSRCALIDLVYKPLYMIEEITNSVKRTFVRSRSALEVVRPEALGVITVSGYTDILG